jgi:hypothetical protein
MAICHCDDCQRQSGASFSINIGVPRENMSVTGDAMKTFVTTGTDSGQDRDRNFCGECGSPLFTVLAEMPALAFIKGGTLDDRDFIVPQIEVWRERAQSWVPASEDRGTFPRDMQA